MKKSLLLLLPLFLFAACEQATREEVKEGAREAVNAPSDYVGANVRAKKQAEVTTATSSVNNAIRMFQASEGRLPKSLDELVAEDYLPALPSLPTGASFKYNAQTGQVTVDGY